MLCLVLQKSQIERAYTIVANATDKPLYWVMEANWYKNWKGYVGFDGDVDTITADEPSKIDNAPLAGEGRAMRADAAKDQDFVVVPHQVWDKLVKVSPPRHPPASLHTPSVRSLVDMILYNRRIFRFR